MNAMLLVSSRVLLEQINKYRPVQAQQGCGVVPMVAWAQLVETLSPFLPIIILTPISGTFKDVHQPNASDRGQWGEAG